MSHWSPHPDRDPAPPRVAAVTGASVGLGRAMAVALGELGWPVALGARRADRLAEAEEAVRKAGGRPFACPLDVRDPDSVEAFFGAARDALGPVEAVVINAGIGVLGAIADVDPEEHRAVVETNLLGAIYCAREAIRGWREAEIASGDLVFVSSETARDPWPQNLVYSASKAGLEHIARGLRLELDGNGARVSIVQLGPSQSEFGTDFPPERFGAAIAAWRRANVWTHPATMKPADVARAVVFALTAPRDLSVHDIVIKPTRPRDVDPS